MRQDTLKIINEPARRGVRYYSTLPNEYRRAQHFKLINSDDGELDVTDEFCARVLPMRCKRISWECKERNYTTNPIKRFLQSRIGCNWNVIYSEICSVLSRAIGNKVGYSSVSDLLFRFVEINTYLGADGKIYCNDSHRSDQLIGFGDFYVDPHTKILCQDNGETYKATLRRRIAERKAEAEKTRVIINEKFQFHKLNGNWYRVYFDKVPDHVYAVKHHYLILDALGQLSVARGLQNHWDINTALTYKYGSVIWAVHKEAASKTDIRKHKLS